MTTAGKTLFEAIACISYGNSGNWHENKAKQLVRREAYQSLASHEVVNAPCTLIMAQAAILSDVLRNFTKDKKVAFM